MDFSYLPNTNGGLSKYIVNDSENLQKGYVDKHNFSLLNKNFIT